jgi:hypothetical protein
MHFFGFWGSLSFGIGFVSIIYLLVAKILNPDVSLSNRPAFYIGLTAMIIGSQLFLAGFLGELIARNSPGRNHYLIEEKIGLD